MRSGQRGRADGMADDVSRPGARSDRTESVYPLHGRRLFARPLARGRADGATLDCSRLGALSPDGGRVSIARLAAVRALSPEGAPIARQTTFRGPARSDRTEGVCPLHGRRLFARPLARGRDDCTADDVSRLGARSARRTRAVLRARTVRSGAGSPRSLARQSREGIYLSHSVNSTSRTGAPASSGMKID